MKAISRLLAVLAVLLLTGCGEKDHPVRTSLVVDTSTMTLSIGESAVRMATSKAEDAVITYTSSNPAVATVDQFGKVTALTEGETTITITMDETKKSWYAASTIEYQVVVKNVSAKALEDVDKSTPLTLVAGEDGKITVTFNGGITLENDIHYTINGSAEQTIAKNTEGSFDITVKKGDVVQFYSINTSLGGSAVAAARGMTRAVDTSTKYINIKPSMKTEIYGNVMSLLKGKDNFANADAIEANNAFYGLFAGAEKLVNSTERKLVLPATTLKEGCYENMFSGCKGIEKAPELPAPALVKDCYKEIFYDCAKLNHVTCLATDISAEGSTKDWLGKAGTEATSAPVLETLVPMPPGSDGLPETWTAKKIVLVESVDIKPELGLVVGEADVTLTVIVLPEDATDKTVTWTSSNPAVATVDDNGRVHAVVPGEATITATAGDNTATCAVKVTAKPSDGLLAGKFSVSDTKQVQFSQGNLQAVVGGGYALNYYYASSWKFAEHQWDYIGYAFAGSYFKTGNTVDLFGWVGSDADNNRFGYGLCASTNDNDYGNTISALKSDWGTLAITNGGNTPNFGWRTLTKDEWVYLFNTRTTTSGIRYAKATVNNVKGVILLPDDWNASYHALVSANTADANFTSNPITAAEWTSDFEAHGAVFLPAAGRRDDSYVNSSGHYWSSTASSATHAYQVYFYINDLQPALKCGRHYGCSVRLVKDVENIQTD